MAQKPTETIPQTAELITELDVQVEGGPHFRGAGPVTLGTADGNVLPLKDTTVSHYHVELSSHADGGILVRDLGSKNGTFVGRARVREAVVEAGMRVRIGETELTVNSGEQQPTQLPEADRIEGLVGDSVAMRRLIGKIRQAAPTETSVLITGESGTGKEVVARALHDTGNRAGGPFVVVDCALAPATLIHSELFGHEPGAFTGATTARVGAFEQASGGTLFLDELGELPVSLQPTLLGALERREIRRLGGKKTIPVDIRVVAATHRDLREMVNAETFRLDLFHRLAVVQVHVPALRERVDDLPALASHFLSRLGHEAPLEDLVGRSVVSWWKEHAWPGNIRELRNLIEATVALGSPPEPNTEALASGDEIEKLLHLPYKKARRVLLESFERRYAGKALSASDGNVSEAARRSGLNRSHMNHLIHRYNLKGEPEAEE